MASSKTFSRALLLLVLAAAALRVLHVALQARSLPFLGHPLVDGAVHDAWAREIAAGRGFGAEPFYHSPGYAAFLGLVYAVAGPNSMAAIWVQCALGVGTVALTAVLGRRLFGPREGLLAGALVLAAAPFYFFEVKLLDPALTVFLALLSVVLAARIEEDVWPARDASRTPGGRGFLALAAGLAAGVLSLVRANLLLVPGILLVLWAARAWRRRSGGRTVATYAAGLAIALAPAFLFNATRGAFVPVATQGGFNFYAGNHRGATGVFEDVPGTSGKIATQEAEADSLVTAALGRPLDPGAESRYWTQRAWSEIAADPLGWGKLLGTKVWLFLNRQEETVNGSLALERERVPLLRAAALPFNVLLALAGWGAVLAVRGRGPRRIPWTAPAALFAACLLSCVLFFVLTRLRLPVVPLLAVFAAHALVAGFGRGGASWRRIALPAAAVVFFSAVTWKSPLGAPRDPAWEATLVLEGAKAREQRGDTAGAIRAYELASSLDPGSLDALLGAAELAVAGRDLPRAVALYETARGLHPDAFHVRNNLGILHFGLGNLEACDAEMAAASAIDPGAGTPWYYRGLVARARGQSARAEFEAAIARAPSLAGAYRGLIEELLEAGDEAGARRWTARAESAGVVIPAHLAPRPMHEGDGSR